MTVEVQRPTVALPAIAIGAPGAIPGPDPIDAITVRAVSKSYGPIGNRVLALHQVDLVVRRGEFVCLLGASGCGKSTLLNLIAGLARPATGTIALSDGKPGLLFQDAALFPWLSVSGNVELPMKLAGVAKADRRSEAARLLELVHLEAFARKQPHELSGGMRQRVALARALAQRCKILLMDEPFGALDAITRDLLHDELERIALARGLTIVFVTHDVREAIRLGDRIVLMTSRPGRIAREFGVDLPRPRTAASPEAASLAAEITSALRSEVRRHATDEGPGAMPPVRSSNERHAETPEGTER